MILMAFVGEKKHRYEAEKNFKKPHDVNEVKSFETYRSFLAELKRDFHSWKTVIICIPNCDFQALKKEINSFEPNATVVHAKSMCV